jgi:AGZA family xanthine/uracil permease-like MFS transporter
MEKYFHLKENGTTVSTEITAGLTTFFAMSYIIVVNPQILSKTGMPWGGVFLATIIAAIIGTLVMGLFANVPYAQAAGMGLNAFFTYTVCFGLGFTWQEALCMEPRASPRSTPRFCGCSSSVFSWPSSSPCSRSGGRC